MANYHVLSQPFVYKLSQVVNDWIKEGWRPIGGIACDRKGEYLQAMYKDDG